jgi:hypothetical protein
MVQHLSQVRQPVVVMNNESPRLASLRAKLKAREGRKEYEKNCEEIRKEIARLEMGPLDL